MITKLTNGIVLYAASMGRVFRVTHICPDTESANAVMAKDHDTVSIAEDNNGFVYLAEAYGSIAPSAILHDLQSKKS